jgi:hypothetical protein
MSAHLGVAVDNEGNALALLGFCLLRARTSALVVGPAHLPSEWSIGLDAALVSKAAQACHETDVHSLFR